MVSCSGGASGPGGMTKVWQILAGEIYIVSSKQGMLNAARFIKTRHGFANGIIIDPKMNYTSHTLLVSPSGTKYAIYSYVQYGALNLPRIGRMCYYSYSMNSMDAVFVARSISDLIAITKELYEEELENNIYEIPEIDGDDGDEGDIDVLLYDLRSNLPVLFFSTAIYFG